MIGKHYLYHVLMKRIVAFILLAGIVYGGWLFYQQSATPSRLSTPPSLSSNNTNFSLQSSSQNLSNLESVLGESISAGIGVVTDIANKVTDGEAEPIINKAVRNFQAELKQLV